jgi:hypothetical protein
MDDQTNDNPLSDSSIGISFEQYGRESASASKADPTTVEASLATVYNQFLKDTKLDADGIKQRITRLEAEILQKKSSEANTTSEIASQELQKADVEKKLEELGVGRIKLINEGAQTDEYVPFVIGLFITILLTFYLFVFYSSTGYSAFYGIKQGTLGLINPDVFANAQAKGGGILVLIILFPVIFLGLGFLIHDALDKKKYALISALLGFTFLVDSIMGYKISENLHNNSFNGGLTNIQWTFSMVWSDINFWFVLMLGFVVYLIWGSLLHYALDKYKEIQPDRVLELKLENLNGKIEEQKNNLLEILAKIGTLKAAVASYQNEINQKEKDVIGYKNGVVPVNVPKLRSIVGQFMKGWFEYIKFMFKDDENKIKVLTGQVAEIQRTWIDHKIKSLDQDS